MKKISLIAMALLLSTIAHSKVSYKFRITLTDKKCTEYSLNKPEKFLSEKSLLRRAKQKLAVDSTDIPVCGQYIKAIRSTGVQILVTSKWNNTVTVRCADSMLVKKITKLPFVSRVELVWRGEERAMSSDAARKDSVTNKMERMENFYGKAFRQIEIHNGQKLHQAGFRGEGMTVAIIDGGYKNANKLAALKSIKLLGTRDFVQPNSDIYEENSHGMMVLSCMASNVPFSIVGTAPEASYWLLRSEDIDSESLVEQDYWAAAVEFADSVGVDVVNTSLGYQKFDDTSKNYNYQDLDGRKAMISRSAGMAADKGMVVVCSAGNEGRGSWKKITPPADAFNVITVGAIDSELLLAPFSSVGNTTDNRVKPDVSAIGQKSVLLRTNGEIGNANGTSFSAPTFCGLLTCLWQSCPELTAKQLIELVRHSCDNSATPNNVYGYGIPDVYKAYRTVHPEVANQ